MEKGGSESARGRKRVAGKDGPTIVRESHNKQGGLVGSTGLAMGGGAVLPSASGGK